jgi:DTW domain-containing protein YfiP
MLADLCVCGLVPRRALGTRLVLLMHHVEAFRQSNTGRLARAVLDNMEIRLRGRPDFPLQLDDLLTGERRPLLLFPGAGARLLETALIEEDSRPVTLLVPDGTWNLARKIPLRQRELDGVERVCLPLEEPSTYRLRHSPHAHQLSTLEAIARALGVLEGPELRADLERVFRVARDRILWSQGKLPEDEVEGGLLFRGVKSTTAM